MLQEPLDLTSQTVQCQRVSTWCLHSLQVQTKRSWPWLCNSTSMHMVLHLQRRKELNSQCLSRANVKKASLPSIRSQFRRGSGSTMGSNELTMGPECRWITKNTWENKQDKVTGFLRLFQRKTFGLYQKMTFKTVKNFKLNNVDDSSNALESKF